MPRVKRESPPEEKDLVQAQLEIDETIRQRHGGRVAADTLLNVMEKGQDERARVTAAKEMINYIRPPKTSPLVNVNLPGVISHLNLPAAPASAGAQPTSNAKLIKAAPKILPEPPKKPARFGAKFLPEAVGEVQPSTLPTPAVVDARKRSPLAKDLQRPAEPPSARSVRPYDREPE